MEFNDIITLILLFVFFVLPSIFKGRGKKKKKAKKKKPGIFSRLGEAINTFIRDLEKQALEAKKRAQQQEQGTVWEEMDDRDPVVHEAPSGGPFPVPDEEKAVPVRVRRASLTDRPRDPDHPFLNQKRQIPEAAERPEADTATPSPERIRMNLPKHELQRAVVWSEILGRPVALRDG